MFAGVVVVVVLVVYVCVWKHFSMLRTQTVGRALLRLGEHSHSNRIRRNCEFGFLVGVGELMLVLGVFVCVCPAYSAMATGAEEQRKSSAYTLRCEAASHFSNNYRAANVAQARTCARSLARSSSAFVLCSGHAIPDEGDCCR